MSQSVSSSSSMSLQNDGRIMSHAGAASSDSFPARLDSSDRPIPAPSSTEVNNDNDMAFVCNICLEGVKDKDPVVTQCGHLYCWPCLYRWLNTRHVSCTCVLLLGFTHTTPIY
ncbi:hypothetical protein EON65_51400 [archaeon]|nr:MAG: hypothetical protein EON65_51400 [archaeon]